MNPDDRRDLLRGALLLAALIIAGAFLSPAVPWLLALAARVLLG